MKKKDTEALAAGLKKISEGFAQLANALVGTETAAPAAEQKPEPVKKGPTKAEAPTKSVTFEDVRGLLASKAAQGHKDGVKALLKKYNASCLSELESHPELFPDIMKDTEVIGDV